MEEPQTTSPAKDAPNPYAPPGEATGTATAPTQSASARPLIPIFIIVFIDVMGLTLIIPLLPFYALKFGATPFHATLLLSVFAVFQLFSGPFLGSWSDRSGRKIVLLVSQAGMLASYFVLGLANALWMVFAGRIIAGITSGNLSVAQAYISDVTKPEDRTKAFGFFGIAFGLGFILGPVLAYALTKVGSESTPFFGSAVLSGLSFAATWVMLPNAKPKGKGGRQAPAFELFRKSETRRRLLEFLLFNLTFSTFIGGFALYLRAQFNFDQTHASLMFVYTGFLGALIQGGLLGRLVRRWGEAKLAFWGFVSMALGNSFLGWVPSWHFLLVAGAVASFGSAVTRPAITTLITKSVSADDQGKALGLGTTLASVSQIVGPPVAGWLIERKHLGAYGLIVGGLSAAGALLIAQRPPAPDK
ncbi:MAG: MFS transporter [Polyangiaceae bacterium]|nr:MFS transporter [Polyangiaceae bacterium]